MKLTLSQQIQAMRQRIQRLSQGAQGDSRPQELLPKAFEELELALEELQTVEAELHQQQLQLLDTREHLEAERQTYQDLFQFAPVGYLLTSPEGIIRRANQAAATLFESIEKFMIGRSLSLYVPEGERRAFRRVVAQLRTMDGVQEWDTRMQPWDGPAFDAALNITVVRDHRGRPVELRWMITKKSVMNERVIGNT
jgi:PAS domain S-box-containing protein